MRTFGWGLFATLLAILVLTMSVKDEYQTKVHQMDHFEQVEALTMPAVVPAVSTIALRAEYAENFAAFNDSWIAIHGEGVSACASRLSGTFRNYNDYAIETDKYTEIEPRQRSGPNLALLIVSFNEASPASKGVACLLARIV